MFKKWSITISRYFFLLIFLGFFGSVTLFKHVHVVNGTSIVHSHPFKTDKNGNPTHGHTTNGYLLLHFAVNFITTTAFSFIVAHFSGLIFSVSLFYIRFFIKQATLLPAFLRGPPENSLS